MANCRLCDQPFGNHAKDCPVKYRDEMNPDPEVQRRHEEADAAYGDTEVRNEA